MSNLNHAKKLSSYIYKDCILYTARIVDDAISMVDATSALNVSSRTRCTMLTEISAFTAGVVDKGSTATVRQQTAACRLLPVRT